jgi:hypothetical protein
MLKLHGTVSRPKEIVLTKRDYIRYNDRFAALSGIVQSTLLTHHLLSIGFSLADDNFHKIFDSVRKAKSSEDDLLAPGDRDSSRYSLASYLSNLPQRKYQKSKFEFHDEDEALPSAQPPQSQSSADCYCTALILKYSRLKVALSASVSVSVSLGSSHSASRVVK